MGDTDKPGEHRGRPGRNGRSSHAAGTSAGAARSLLCENYYRSLLQLAALLTGDAAVAEAAVADALAAIPSVALGWSPDDRLRYMQRLVLVRCRRAGRYRRLSVRGGQDAAAPGFGRLPVVMALLGLPRSAREAIVLTHYLDLPAAQAAVIAGVSETLLSANLANAMLALDDRFIGLSPDS
jgi:DNA-directed RNA polymerase specialized sigma24 family protein